MTLEPLVSIITPLYNTAPFIERTLQSVQAQSYQNWEMLITDDCSTDNGPEIVRQYTETDNRIKLFKNSKNSGPGVARNKSIKEAKGKYIAFLDADDQWKKNKLTTQIQFMETQRIDFSFSYYEQIDEEGNLLKRLDQYPKKVSYKDTLKSNKIGCLTAVYNAETLGKTYMEIIKRRQDYTLWLKLLKKTSYAYCIPQVLATYTIRRQSISSNKLKLIKYNWLVLYKIERLPLFKSLYYIVYHISQKLFRN